MPTPGPTSAAAPSLGGPARLAAVAHLVRVGVGVRLGLGLGLGVALGLEPIIIPVAMSMPGLYP